MDVPIGSREVSFDACAKMRVRGSGMFSSTSPSNFRILPARRSRSARPAAPAVPASIPLSTNTRNATKASRLPAAIRPAGTVPDGWNWQEARDEFIRFAQRRALGPSTASLVRAAESRGIPWLRLNDQSLVQLGHGKYQQRIQATVTS